MFARIATRTGVQLPSPPFLISKSPSAGNAKFSNKFASLPNLPGIINAASLRTGFQPFAPKAWSAIRIRAGIIIKRTDEFRAVCRVRSLPIPGFIRLKHVVAVTQDFLAVNDVLQRHAAGVSQHVVQHHEGGRSSQPGFAVKMRPGIFWKTRGPRE